MIRPAATLTATARLAAGFIALAAFAGVFGQLALNIGKAAAAGTPAWQELPALYGYFTIWSNTLIGLIALHAARGGDEAGFFGRPLLRGAAVTYIIVVGTIYHTLLAAGRNLHGAAWGLDNLLHSVVPVAWPLWWLAFAPRGALGWRHVVPAMVFPLAYAAVALGRGAVTHKYAYFFLNADTYGWPRVLGNSIGLALFFGGLMALLVLVDRWRAGAPVAARAA